MRVGKIEKLREIGAAHQHGRAKGFIEGGAAETLSRFLVRLDEAMERGRGNPNLIAQRDQQGIQIGTGGT